MKRFVFLLTFALVATLGACAGTPATSAANDARVGLALLEGAASTMAADGQLTAAETSAIQQADAVAAAAIAALTAASGTTTLAQVENGLVAFVAAVPSGLLSPATLAQVQALEASLAAQATSSGG